MNGSPLLGLAEVEDAHDRRVHQARGGARLGEEALAGAGGGAIAADELDRDVDVERDVVRQPDRAHAAAADDAREPVLVAMTSPAA